MTRLSSLRVYEKFRSLFKPFHRVAVMTPEFELLYLKPESLADIGTLPQAAEVSHKYLRLNDGDITITNDPYSGGTIVCSPTLVMGIGTKQPKNGAAPAELLVASRVTFFAQVGPAKTIDDEGLRIPPTPFFSKGAANEAIVEALKSHPLLPPDFIPRIEDEVARLLELRERVKREMASDSFNRSHWRDFLRHSEEAFSAQLEELPEGSGTFEVDVSSKESIRLRAEIYERHVLFDFTGTSPGQTMFMTDSATMGAAVGTFISLLKSDIPINTGVLSRFEIKAPKGSLVNSPFPRPVFLGHIDGLNLLANAVTAALYRIDPKLAWAMSGMSHCTFQLEFKNGTSCMRSLPTGLGATNSRAGLDAVFAWRKFEVSIGSIEKVESIYPVEFLHCGFRANSGGQGKLAGGLGAAESIKILEDATISWNYLKPPYKPEGLNGGKSGQDGEIVVLATNGQKTVLPSSGRLELHAGDVVTVLTGGGGGFGAPPAE